MRLSQHRKPKIPTGQLRMLLSLLFFAIFLLMTLLISQTALHADGAVGFDIGAGDDVHEGSNYDYDYPHAYGHNHGHDHESNTADLAYGISHQDYDDYDTTTTTTTTTDTTHHLPIDITAIGRQGQPDTPVSVRLFELDLFSPNSQIVNQAMSAHHYTRRAAMSNDLFESFEGQRQIDINERIYYAADSMNLFAQPMAFRTIGQAESDDSIPVWVIVVVLAACAVLGYIFSKAIAVKRAESNKR